MIVEADRLDYQDQLAEVDVPADDRVSPERGVSGTDGAGRADAVCAAGGSLGRVGGGCQGTAGDGGEALSNGRRADAARGATRTGNAIARAETVASHIEDDECDAGERQEMGPRTRPAIGEVVGANERAGQREGGEVKEDGPSASPDGAERLMADGSHLQRRRDETLSAGYSLVKASLPGEKRRLLSSCRYSLVEVPPL